MPEPSSPKSPMKRGGPLEMSCNFKPEMNRHMPAPMIPKFPYHPWAQMRWLAIVMPILAVIGNKRQTNGGSASMEILCPHLLKKTSSPQIISGGSNSAEVHTSYLRIWLIPWPLNFVLLIDAKVTAIRTPCLVLSNRRPCQDFTFTNPTIA